uniref:Uncharacterized protein n=1 Tax=Oryza brachyantha TaxID=4533 RepID=J3MKG7_ORYBR
MVTSNASCFKNEMENRGGLCLSVPMYIEEPDYIGEGMGTQQRCKHGLRPKRMTACKGEDIGRRFLECPLQEEE